MAAISFESADPTQVREGRARDGRLVAEGHVELLNPTQVHKGRVCDGRLSAVARVKRLDPTQMHKGCVQGFTWLQSTMLSD